MTDTKALRERLRDEHVTRLSDRIEAADAIERLERERDEARTEEAAARHRAAGYEKAMDEQQREIEGLTASNAELREALRDQEYGKWNLGGEAWECNACGAWERVGKHAPDCRLARALSRTPAASLAAVERRARIEGAEAMWRAWNRDDSAGAVGCLPVSAVVDAAWPPERAASGEAGRLAGAPPAVDRTPETSTHDSTASGSRTEET